MMGSRRSARRISAVNGLKVTIGGVGNLRYAVVPVTPFQQNCTIVWCPGTMLGAAVDPGGDVDQILRAARDNAVTLEKIMLTHGHIDHVGGAVEIAELLKVPIEGPHIGDRFWLEGMEQQCRVFGVPAMPAFTPDRWLAAGDHVAVGKLRFEVRHCPGHTPGHVILFNAAARLALVGDVLFAGSIGRTDFPGGDYDTLIRSIRENCCRWATTSPLFPATARCRPSARNAGPIRSSPTGQPAGALDSRRRHRPVHSRHRHTSERTQHG